MKIGKNVIISPKASIYNPDNIEIGDNVRIDDFCILSGGSGLKIGNHVHIACYVALFAGAGIYIGNFVGISARGTVYSQSDDYSGEFLYGPMIPIKYKKLSSGLVIIKSHSIVGVNSTIMPGVILEEGVAVGAYSLVKNKCDAWSMYAGIPAQKIKDRKKDLLKMEEDFLKE
jgi:galactoside O-acetyltransferase